MNELHVEAILPAMAAETISGGRNNLSRQDMASKLAMPLECRPQATGRFPHQGAAGCRACAQVALQDGKTQRFRLIPGHVGSRCRGMGHLCLPVL
jgi:hypothetical protein